MMMEEWENLNSGIRLNFRILHRGRFIWQTFKKGLSVTLRIKRSNFKSNLLIEPNIPIRIYIHTAVHRNIISIVKPTRCTNVSILFYFRMTHYMFRTVFPSVIRSLRLYIQHYLCDKCLLLYVQS